jgi:hypothetical protein
MKHTVETKEKIRSLELFLPFLFYLFIFIFCNSTVLACDWPEVQRYPVQLYIDFGGKQSRLEEERSLAL